jgi:predicted nucleic acid-binding protein
VKAEGVARATKTSGAACRYDTLIAQSCLDHDVPLITRDADFRPFERLARLKLVR